MLGRRIKVLVVDDSAVVRQRVTAALSREPDIEVVGAAPDPYVAREMVVSLTPDVLTLDVEMPRMDGLTFLRHLMAAKPTPTIVFSSVAPKGCDTAVACLEAGAFEVLSKPSEAYSAGEALGDLVALVRAAAGTTPRPTRAPGPKQAKPPSVAVIGTTHRVVALGASTGGTEAIKAVLTGLPPTCPGIAIVQHMPPGFTASFAQRLNDQCQIEVREARDGDALAPGLALLAPGGRHLALRRDGARYVVAIFDGSAVSRHKPSVDVLMDSAARYAGKNCLGVMLTGMGDDGAKGMLALRQAGGATVAQDEATSVVWGMPGSAVKLGAVERVVPLNEVSSEIMLFAARPRSAAA